MMADFTKSIHMLFQVPRVIGVSFLIINTYRYDINDDNEIDPFGKKVLKTFAPQVDHCCR